MDGVVRHWPPPDQVGVASGLPAGAFVAVAFAPARLLPAITGEVTDEQWRSAVAGDLAERYGGSVADRIGVAAERCLFVDDTAGHVAAAREAGMAAVHFRGIEDLTAALAPLLSEGAG